MYNKDFLKCCKVVLNFLLVSNSEYVIFKDFNVLTKHENFMINKVGGVTSRKINNMVLFGKYLEYKYNITLWEKSPIEFFGTELSRNFLKKIIREEKIKILLNEI